MPTSSSQTAMYVPVTFPARLSASSACVASHLAMQCSLEHAEMLCVSTWYLLVIQGQLPLEAAAGEGLLDIVELLLEYDKGKDYTDGALLGPLETACFNGQDAVRPSYTPSYATSFLVSSLSLLLTYRSRGCPLLGCGDMCASSTSMNGLCLTSQVAAMLVSHCQANNFSSHKQARPLAAAAIGCHVRIMKRLLRYEGMEGRLEHALLEAVWKGDAKVGQLR